MFQLLSSPLSLLLLSLTTYLCHAIPLTQDTTNSTLSANHTYDDGISSTIQSRPIDPIRIQIGRYVMEFSNYNPPEASYTDMSSFVSKTDIQSRKQQAAEGATEDTPLKQSEFNFASDDIAFRLIKAGERMFTWRELRLAINLCNSFLIKWEEDRIPRSDLSLYETPRGGESTLIARGALGISRSQAVDTFS